MEYESSTLGSEQETWGASRTGEPEGLGAAADRMESGMRNWRQNFESRPWLFLGAAFTAGCVAAALIPTQERNGSYYDADDEDVTPAYGGTRMSAGPSKSTYLSETWSKMQSAFVVAVTRQAENFLEEMVPGFQEAYRERGGGTDAKLSEDEVR